MVDLQIINNKNEVSINKCIKDVVICCPNNFCAYYDSNGRIHNIEDYIVVDDAEHLVTYTSETALYGAVRGTAVAFGIGKSNPLNK